MTVPKTIGLPRMMKEPGEKRVFLPEFVQFLAERGLIEWRPGLSGAGGPEDGAQTNG